MKTSAGLVACVGLAALLTASCSLDKVAIDMVANTLTSGGGGNTFTEDNDPVLVAKSLPFALKLFETLLAKDPTNSSLGLQTGSLYIMYANAFVQSPAQRLPDSEYQKQTEMLKEAKLLYLRGRGYVLKALDVRHPGFVTAADSKGPALAKLLTEMTGADVPYLYWAAAGWMAAYAVNPLDFALSVTITRPLAMMKRAYELDPGFNRGAIPEFYISYDAAAPESLGGGLAAARAAFEQALAYSDGKRASVYVAMAQAVDVQEHNSTEFRTMLDKALAIDPNADLQNRLATILAQQQARWLLDHIDNFFLAP